MKIAYLGTFVRRLGKKNYKPLANKKLKTVPFLALDFSAFQLRLRDGTPENCFFEMSSYECTSTSIWYRKIPKISPGAYIFPRRFLRGLFLEGLIRWEICLSKSAWLILGGKFTSQNRLGQLIVRSKFMSVVCGTFLLKLALRTQNLLKLSHASTLSIWSEEI